MALAYLLAKGSSKALKTNFSVPIVMVLAIIPDMDILFEPYISHRGPTHSLISAILIFIPVFIVYRKRAIPYFVGLISHGLIGDFIVGGQLQLLWPISRADFGLHELGFPLIGIESLANVILELSLFVLATFCLWKTSEYKQFMQYKIANFVLTIPIITVLLPSVIGYPLAVPILLIPPHLFYLILFLISVIIVFYGLFKAMLKHL
jgi:membrane-bound metal-dependent hydrolase YbcI (DUF457 family)